MFFLILAVAVILVAGVLYLPYAAGLTTLEVEKKKKKIQTHEDDADQDFGYVPPDVAAARSAKSTSIKSQASSLRDRIASQDIPVKIKLDSSNNLRRRTKERLDVDSNPNNYDYDIDELIREEAEEAAQEQMRQDYKGEVLGKDKEAMV